MFRRFGFKWAEGVANVSGGTVFGYGGTVEKNKLLSILEKQGYNINSTYCINVDDCTNADFDPMRIAETLGIKV